MFDQFTMRFPTYAVTLGFTLADATALRNEFEWFHYAAGCQQCFEQELAERIAFKRALRDGPIGSAQPTLPDVPAMAPPAGAMPAPGIVPRLRKVIQRIKNHPNCTEAILQDLGIATPGSSAGGTPKPDARCTSFPNSQVEIAAKKGTHEAIRIESQRGDETTWALLDKVTRMPFVDTRAPLVAGKPEERRYRLIYVDANVPVGDYSDIITAITRP